MNEIGKVYGAALFMLAIEEDRATEYGDALQEIQTVFSENPDCLRLLEVPSEELLDCDTPLALEKCREKASKN